MKSKKYECSINRSFKIDTMEAKARAAGMVWKIPDGFEPSIEPVTVKGVDYDRHTDFIEILDFDGEKKKTIVSRFYNKDGSPYNRQDEIGFWQDGLRGRFFGSKSRNFKPDILEFNEIIELLMNGYSVSPGLFDHKTASDRSWRSIESLIHSGFCLFDGDAWKSDPNFDSPPQSYEDLLLVYPDIESDFSYIGESISSRSQLKPYLNLRLGVLLPEVITPKMNGKKQSSPHWEEIVLYYGRKYPFIDYSVGSDQSRLSYGNARSKYSS